jgi:hypothetical protein
LAVVAKPIAKVDTFDVELAKLLAAGRTEISKVNRVSSTSPCLQFWPSISEVEPMFPAPKARVGQAKKRTTIKQDRSQDEVEVETAMLTVREASGEGTRVSTAGKAEVVGS